MVVSMPEYQKNILEQAIQVLSTYAGAAEKELKTRAGEADEWLELSSECADSEEEFMESVMHLMPLLDRKARMEERCRLLQELIQRMNSAEHSEQVF